MKIGDRVGAIAYGDEKTKTVFMFGYGTYQGRDYPPKGTIFLGMDFHDMVRKFAKDYLDADCGNPTERDIDTVLESMRGEWGNPKLVMDDGMVVFGCQCWWGPEDKVKKQVETYQTHGYTVKPITLEEYTKNAD